MGSSVQRARRACRARAATLSVDTSRPSSSTVPRELTWPPTAFTNVDLPAPLVPISPTISPAPTSMSTPDTALMPPKLTETPRARSATPPPSPTPVLARAAERWRAAGTEDDLAAGCGSAGGSPLTAQSQTPLRVA